MQRPLIFLWLLVFAAFAHAESTLVNLAQGKTATGSSVYTGAPASQFADANDGNRDGHYFNGLSVFHSADPDPAPFSYWEVDLGADYNLDRIMIWPRTDANPPQTTVRNYKLSVRNAAGAGVWEASFYPVTGTVINVWGTSAVRGKVGRYVRIEKLDRNPSFLTFAEFEVWGTAQNLPTNLAFNRPTTSSSPGGFNTSAQAGNDGELGGDYALPGNPIFHTSVSGVGQFWEVDLGQDREIDYAMYFSRTDFANLANVRVKIRNNAGVEVYTTLANIGRDTIVRGGRQFDVLLEIPGTIMGRYLRLETTGNEYLSFTELEIFGPVPDTVPPVISVTEPAAGALVGELLQAEVLFNEDVTGVTADDLLVRGVPASGVIALSPRRYAFTFAQPASGSVQFTWATGHGIVDKVGLPFGSAGWAVTLDTSLPAGQPIITEFVADNAGGLRDADDDSPDWLEITNVGPVSVNLGGWFLTDLVNHSIKWRFPATVVPAGGRIIVFASEKNRAVAGAELHTDFKLAKEGGYLALLKADGITVASEWAYGAQRENVGFGIGRALNPVPLVASNATAKYLVPDNAVPGWETRTFNDAAWTSAPSGFGFDEGVHGGGLLGFWNFDDPSNPGFAGDASGEGRNGTISVATYTGDGGGRTSLPGDYALNFPGTVNFPAAGSGAFDSSATNDQITLSAWIFGSPAQPAQSFLFYAGSLAGGAGDRVLTAHAPWSDSIIYWDTVMCCDHALHRVFVGEPNPSKWKDQWNHYVFIKRGDIKEIWQNGQLLHSAINTADFVPFRSLYLGSVANGTQPYRGLVDDFAIWDTALSPEEIAALAAGGSPLEARKLTSRIATNLAPSVLGTHPSAYFRYRFNAPNPAELNILSLKLNYDDGFVAYLNGTEVLRRNAPGSPAYDSTAPLKRSAAAGLTTEEFDLSQFASLLVATDNVLAIHVMNSSIDDPTFLIRPELFAGKILTNRYFTPPTPGVLNTGGYSGFVNDTIFAPRRGLYSTPQTVTITCSTPGAIIAYTTDGSDPSPTNGLQGPSPRTVQITTTTVLRAIAFAPDRTPTNIDTHTYLFVDAVANQTKPASVGDTWPGGFPADFTMDSRIYDGATPGHSVKEGLLSIPTLSITLPDESIWTGTGLYPNSAGRGATYERAANAEYIVPGQPDAGFHIRFGLRVHGNISRDKGFTPKHGFKMFFRGEYGKSKLESNLFGGGIESFDQLILRGGSTDTWPVTEWATTNIGPGGSQAYRWLRPWASYVRDQWVRDAGIAMGQPQARGHFVHLYLNGLYWGLYNLTEHPDEDFCANTFGGKSSEWDTLKDFAELESGTIDAWNQLITLTNAGLASNANYQRLLGRNADGTVNASFNVLLNETSLIDYILLHVFIGADDWPNHNWWAGRKTRGTGGDGFHFFAWDQEISNENHLYERTAWGYIYQDSNSANTPSQVYFAARSNLEFRLRFADRIQRHLFNGGALSMTKNVQRWNARTTEVDKAVVAESARWGDYQRPEQPYTRELEWLTHLDFMNGTYWPNINNAALTRFTAAGLWPATKPPVLSQHGGSIPITSQVSITNPNATGAIYYSTNGNDPRAFGGAIAAGALTYGSPLPAANVTIKARVRSSGGEWSALTEAFFTTVDVDTDADGLGDTWEQANGFTVGANESLLDADGDGYSNLLEYRSGTNPRSPSDFLQFTSVVKTSNQVTLKFNAKANHNYLIQRSGANLSAWTDIATYPAQPTDQVITVIDPVILPQQFYRIAPTVP